MIRPSEIAKEVAASSQALLAEAERDIDAALRDAYGNKAEIWIAIQRPWTPRICEELIRRYQDAGWKVRSVFDQRDGNALVFSAEAAG